MSVTTFALICSLAATVCFCLHILFCDFGCELETFLQAQGMETLFLACTTSFFSSDAAGIIWSDVSIMLGQAPSTVVAVSAATAATSAAFAAGGGSAVVVLLLWLLPLLLLQTPIILLLKLLSPNW